MKPRWINIFLLDRDPNGIRVAQISMSTIQAIAFRRNQLGRVRQAFPEIERPGVHIMIDADKGAHDRQLASLGESEVVGARLTYHNSNEAGRDAKKFLDRYGRPDDVCQDSCPPGSCGVSEFEGAVVAFRVQPDVTDGRPVARLS